MASEQESNLLVLLKSRDQQAFEELVRSLSPRLLSSAVRILANQDDARDAVQETFVSVWKNIGQFAGDSSLYTWIHRIVINACLARLRSSRTRKEVDLEGVEAGTPDPVGYLGGQWSDSGPSLEKRTAMRQALERALDKLPRDLRLVLLLRDVEELSSKETAVQLGIADDLVRQRLHRARTIMAETLRPELCDGPELTCGGQLDLLLDYIDSVLASDLRQPVHDHIESCPACKNLLSAYRTTIGLTLALRNAVQADADHGFVERTAGAAGALAEMV
jgi:RNA polymerase sigma-70 factor (ECF subfamily)